MAQLCEGARSGASVRGATGRGGTPSGWGVHPAPDSRPCTCVNVGCDAGASSLRKRELGFRSSLDLGFYSRRLETGVAPGPPPTASVGWVGSPPAELRCDSPLTLAGAPATFFLCGVADHLMTLT